jgi:hypothetical protein
MMNTGEKCLEATLAVSPVDRPAVPTLSIAETVTRSLVARRRRRRRTVHVSRWSVGPARVGGLQLRSSPSPTVRL